MVVMFVDIMSEIKTWLLPFYKVNAGIVSLVER